MTAAFAAAAASTTCAPTTTMVSTTPSAAPTATMFPATARACSASGSATVFGAAARTCATVVPSAAAMVVRRSMPAGGSNVLATACMRRTAGVRGHNMPAVIVVVPTMVIPVVAVNPLAADIHFIRSIVVWLGLPVFAVAPDEWEASQEPGNQDACGLRLIQSHHRPHKRWHRLMAEPMYFRAE